MHLSTSIVSITYVCTKYFQKYFQKYLVKSQVRRNKNATSKKILLHSTGQLSFAPMPSFMDSRTADMGLQGKDSNAFPPHRGFYQLKHYLQNLIRQ